MTKERIKELFELAGTDVSGKWMNISNAESFVELIIEECCLKLNELNDHSNGNHNYYAHAALKVKEHFRVE